VDLIPSAIAQAETRRQRVETVVAFLTGVAITGVLTLL